MLQAISGGADIEDEEIYCPWWFTHAQAARYLHVDPDRLFKISLFWKDVALKCMDAEEHLRHELSQRGMI